MNLIYLLTRRVILTKLDINLTNAFFGHENIDQKIAKSIEGLENKEL